MNRRDSVITLTFGDQAENHVGMEQIGSMVDEGDGFNLGDLVNAMELFVILGHDAKIYDLVELSGYADIEHMDAAYVLVIRDGVDAIFRNARLDMKHSNDSMFDEQASLDVDKKAFMYGRVVNKNARWNLCFDDESQDPDYMKGKGRIVSYADVPITNKLIELLPYYIGPKANNLKGEGNYYYDKNVCGIGFHGDSERRKVIAVRLGSSMDIHYQWYVFGNPVGNRITIPLSGGDIYVMSEKAVGTDWKCRNTFTLRHATGCSKYTK